ncbi:MAG TPA: protein kinase, partial [Ktedonobacterales bacterium]|nr:protein kinase [Ktedonobacterales bacterium]
MQWNDLIGARLGQYEIVEELGRGASARVYKAYQESMQRYVAVKVLGNDAEDRAGFVRRFEREAEVVAQLNHPNIVAVYDSGEADGLVYLVMQCVNGGTFRQRMGQAVGVDVACSAAFQVARALQHAHSRGIVHRDVKPSNMLIDSDDNNRILLTDFGIAKLAGIRGLTKSGTTIGTAEYMSPEQAEGREVDGRADIYSLGCVLYESLAGRAPFVGSTPVSVLYQQVHTRPDYIRALNPQVPRELARVLEMALAKQPEDRFDTAEGFAQALQPFTIGFDRGTQPGFGRQTPPSGRLPGAASVTPPPVPGFGDPPSGPLPPMAGFAQAPLHGLGSEGLDALFPDDPEAKLAYRPTPPPAAAFDAPTAPGAPLVGYPEPTTLPPRRPVAFTGPRPTIPLKALDSQPLGVAPAPQPAADLAALEDLPTAALPPLEPPARHRAAPRAAAVTAAPPRRPIRFDPPRRPRRAALLPTSGRSWTRAAVTLTVLAALGIVWLGAHAVASRSAQPPIHVAARPTATATLAPTAAPTTAPTPATTPTPSPQQIADAQAAAAFRAITVTAQPDNGCATTTTTFTTSQSINVNICVAQSARSGLMT